MHVIHEQPEPRQQVFFLTGGPLQYLKSSSAAIVAHFREPLLMDRHQVQIVNELPVAAAARPPKVHEVIGELIRCEHRLDSWISHGVMLQRGGAVFLDCTLDGPAEAAE